MIGVPPQTQVARDDNGGNAKVPPGARIDDQF
jgi:hypothetical protein